MYIATLVDDVQKVIEQLKAERGDFVLAMLYKRDDLSETGWNLILSAVWSDRMGKFDATSVATDALSEGLDVENKRAVSRITILPTSDPFVREITSFYQVASPGSGMPIQNVSVAGIPISSGFVFYSQRIK